MENEYQYAIDGIDYVYIQENYILIEVYVDGYMDYYYIKTDNKKKIYYNEKEYKIQIDDKVNIIFESKPIGISVDNNGYIWVMINGDKIYLYDINGKHIDKIEAPRGYQYFRFFNLEMNINVVCQGKENHADSYGRNDWRFEYRDKNWVKIGITY